MVHTAWHGNCLLALSNKWALSQILGSPSAEGHPPVFYHAIWPQHHVEGFLKISKPLVYSLFRQGVQGAIVPQWLMPSHSALNTGNWSFGKVKSYNFRWIYRIIAHSYPVYSVAKYGVELSTPTVPRQQAPTSVKTSPSSFFQDFLAVKIEGPNGILWMSFPWAV